MVKSRVNIPLQEHLATEEQLEEGTYEEKILLFDNGTQRRIHNSCLTVRIEIFV